MRNSLGAGRGSTTRHLETKKKYEAIHLENHVEHSHAWRGGVHARLDDLTRSRSPEGERRRGGGFAIRGCLARALPKEDSVAQLRWTGRLRTFCAASAVSA